MFYNQYEHTSSYYKKDKNEIPPLLAVTEMFSLLIPVGFDILLTFFFLILPQATQSTIQVDFKELLNFKVFDGISFQHHHENRHKLQAGTFL